MLPYPPALNNHDVTVFDAGAQMVRTDGVDFVVIAPLAGVRSADAFPTINDAGVVSFRGDQYVSPYLSGAYKSDGITLSTVADSSGEFSGSFNFTSINNLGDVAFQTFYDTGGYGDFVRRGDDILTVADTDSGRFVSLSTPSINDQGQVAFAGDGGGAPPNGVYRWQDGVLTTIAEEPDFHTYHNAWINNAGQIAFVGYFTGGVEGVFVGDGESVVKVADRTGPFDDFEWCVDINDHGLVAFVATLDTGERGVFVGDGLNTRTIALVGQPLDGSVITGLEFWHGLNDRGHVAFQASLADGRQGIYLTVPEPAASLLILGAVPLVYWRRAAASGT